MKIVGPPFGGGGGGGGGGGEGGREGALKLKCAVRFLKPLLFRPK